jgi:hypothetical protein
MIRRAVPFGAPSVDFGKVRDAAETNSLEIIQWLQQTSTLRQYSDLPPDST